MGAKILLDITKEVFGWAAGKLQWSNVIYRL